MSDISAHVADWTREYKKPFSWNPSRSLLASLRDYQKHKSKNSLFGRVLSQLAVLRHRFWSMVTGADIPINTRIGGGLLMPHPNGIVIHPDSSIGPNCLIFQQVTIGSRNGGVPHIGGHVDFGAGAKVLGPITVGEHAVIGANAVVLTDVPAHASAVGIPARILPDPASQPESDPPP